MADVQYSPDYADAVPTPHLYIQWKGTDLCGDFRCSCGAQFHVDAMFVYGIKCAACGAVWKTPHTVKLERAEPGYDLSIHETELDEEFRARFGQPKAPAPSGF